MTVLLRGKSKIIHRGNGVNNKVQRCEGAGCRKFSTQVRLGRMEASLVV